MKALKILAAVVCGLLLLLFLGIGFGVGWSVFFGPETRTLNSRVFEKSDARLERGSYLVNSVMGCLDCHTLPGAPAGSGGTMIDEGSMLLVASNLTSDPESGLGRWTDDQIARAIREGIGGDGRPLFPMMPYQNYREMDDEDLTAVVVYLRTLPPAKTSHPKSKFPPPLPLILRTMPKAVNGEVRNQATTKEERGRYLTRMASCHDCHTPFDSRRVPLAGLDLAGGSSMSERGETAVMSNITPDASGIGGFTPDLFREVMRTGMSGGRQISHIMPYTVYGKMTDDDLNDMFAFLRTVKPIPHWVGHSGQASLCPVCQNEHPLAERNSAPAAK